MLKFSRVVVRRSFVTDIHSLTEKFKNNFALFEQGKAFTYKDIYEESRKVAGKMQALGVEPGDRFAFLCEPGIDFISCLWACWYLRLIAVPISVKHPVEEISYIFENADPSGIYSSSKFSEILSKSNENYGIPCLSDDFVTLPTTPENSLSSDPSLMIYTSGTTGRPKGVIHTAESLTAQCKMVTVDWHYQETDSFLHCLPLHHVHGLVNNLIAVHFAGASVKMHKNFNAKDVLSDLQNETGKKCSVFMAVPTIYVKLMEEAEKQNLKNIDVSDYRLVISGSAAMPDPVAQRWLKFANKPLLERYGMTEFGMGLSQPYEEKSRVPSSVGTPMSSVRARIRKGSESFEPQLDGCSYVEGDLEISSPGLFKEYWKAPELTAKELTSDGWFKTGDRAKFEDGNYYILGRSSVDIIKSGGYKISALEIERVLLAHQGIKEAAVVGLDDETWGQTICLIASLSDDKLSLDEINQWATSKLASYKLPKKLITVHEIPRNAMGKVNKKSLIRELNL